MLKEIELKTPKAVVSCSVYGPTNLLISLYSIALISDYSKCPHLEILIEDSESRTVKAFVGFLVWNGVRVTQPFSAVVKSVFGDIFDWVMATHFGATVDCEATALAAHNLDAVLVEWRFSGNAASGPYELTTKQSKLLRLVPESWMYKPINEFAESHAEYLAQLRHGIEDNIAGIQESTLSSANVMVEK